MTEVDGSDALLETSICLGLKYFKMQICAQYNLFGYQFSSTLNERREAKILKNILIGKCNQMWATSMQPMSPSLSEELLLAKFKIFQN